MPSHGIRLGIVLCILLSVDSPLFEIAVFLGDQTAQPVGTAFGIEPVVGNAFFPAQLPAGLQVTPEKRGNTHDWQKQRPQNGGLNRMTKFMNLHLRITIVAMLAQKQEHPKTQAAALVPFGDNAAVKGSAGCGLVKKKNEKSCKGLWKPPDPLPKPEQKSPHDKYLPTISSRITRTRRSISSRVVSRQRETRKEPSIFSGDSFIAVSV